MRKTVSQLLGVLTGLLVAFPAVAHDGDPSHFSCRMFPPNKLRYPIRDGFAQTGVSQRTWNQVLDAVEKVYTPIFQARGAKLELVRHWTNPEVNAGAEQGTPGIWAVHMFGGLARHPKMTAEGLLLVACHEVGHHLGGAPHYPGEWASTEGQSDYFAALKCMREVLKHTDNRSFVNKLASAVPTEIEQRCERFHQKNQDADPQGMAICLRTHVAAQSVAYTLTDAMNSARKAKGLPLLPIPELGTPDKAIAPRTIVSEYPGLQCRVDTYAAAATCPIGLSVALNSDRPNEGVCLRPARGASLQTIRRLRLQDGTTSLGEPLGARPACWYNQDEMENYKRLTLRVARQ